MNTLLEYWKYLFKWNYKATRKQFWIPTLVYSTLYNILFVSTGTVVRGFGSINVSNTNPFVMLIGLVFFIAQLTITARRLHDTNRSAGWIFISLIPIIGLIVMIVFLCQPSKSEKEISEHNFSTFQNQAD